MTTQKYPINGLLFSSPFDVKSMVSILREKIPHINWRMGDSYYEGFYVLGRTKEEVKIKITEEDVPGKYYLGIYFYDIDPKLDTFEKQMMNKKLQHEVLKTIGVRKKGCICNMWTMLRNILSKDKQ